MVEESANYIRNNTKHRPKIGVICGSGLGKLNYKISCCPDLLGSGHQVTRKGSGSEGVTQIWYTSISDSLPRILREKDKWIGFAALISNTDFSLTLLCIILSTLNTANLSHCRLQTYLWYQRINEQIFFWLQLISLIILVTVDFSNI